MGKSREGHRVLLDERPLVLLPSLAKAIGVTEALVVQQLHYYLQNTRVGELYHGRRWVWHTHDSWLEEFPFLTKATLRRTLQGLVRRKVLLTCRPQGFDRTTRYAIDYRALDALLEQDERKSP